MEQPLIHVDAVEFEPSVAARSFCRRTFPWLQWLPTYSAKNDLIRDVVAGLTVGVMAVPQAMSYATVAGLPPVYGLYNAFVGLLPYPFFGTSPHLISGPTAVMSILVGGAIPTTIAGGTVHACDTSPPAGITEEQTCPERIGLALLLAFIAGVFQLIMGTLRLGFLVDLVSEPVISGFTSGAAFLIAATQFSNSLGIQKCTKLKNVGTGMLYSEKNIPDPKSWTKTDALDGFYVKQCANATSHSCHTPTWHEISEMPDAGAPILETVSWPTTLSKCENSCAANKDCGGFSFEEHDSMNVVGSCLFHEQVEAVYMQFGVISWHTVYYGLACLFVLYIFQFQMKKCLPSNLKIISNLGPLCIVVVSVIIVMVETSDDLAKFEKSCSTDSCTSNAYNPQKYFEKAWDIKVIGMICKEGGLACLPDFTTPFSLHFCPENGRAECTAGEGKEEYLKFKDFGALIVPAISVALIGYMESMTIAKTVAKLRAKVNDGGSFKLKIDPSQELVALGMCNVAVSFLRGYPVTGSFSRTAVNGDSGARSPFASMTCALVVGGALVLLTNYLKYLPKVVLATIVLISIVKLVDIEEALYLFRVCKRDFVVFTIIFLATIFLGVEDALLIGILSNWALYLSHTNKTQVTVLGRRKGDSHGNFLDVLASGEPDSERHVVVLKLFTDICFSSASSLKQTVEDATNAVPDTKIVVLDCTNVNELDGSGLHALGAITSELAANNRRLVIGGMPRHCRRVMELAQKHKEELLTGKGRWDPTNRTDEQVELVESAGPAGQTTPPVLVCFASIDAAVQHAVFVTGQVGGAAMASFSVQTTGAKSAREGILQSLAASEGLQTVRSSPRWTMPRQLQ